MIFNQNAYSQFGSNYSPNAGHTTPEDGFGGARQAQASQSYQPGQIGFAGGTTGQMPTQRPSSGAQSYQPQGARSAPPSPSPTPSLPNAGMTWSQMQSQGYARPPFPSQPLTPGSSLSSDGRNVYGMVSQSGSNLYANGNDLHAAGLPSGAMGTSFAMNGGAAPAPAGSPFAAPGSLGQRLTQAYTGYQGLPAFQNPVSGSAIDSQTQQGVQGLLNQPSPYLTQAYQSQLDKTMGSIDDQYNQADLALHQNIASRGLDTAGTIGASDQRYNNLMRRSAKTDAATNLLNQLAQTYSGDRLNAITAGMGYGSQQYGQAQGTYGTNQAANAQNFGQQQTALENLLNYGQQGFNNQLATAQFNAGQDQMNTQMLLQLLGAGY
jgi:hypothetical protein